jgi:uncharacterized repeat protein (TIGR03803 family)
MKTLGSAAVLVLIGLSLLAGNADAQTVTFLHSFGSAPNDGIGPFAGLVQGSDGNFYGTTEYGGTSGNGIVFRINPGGSYTSLYSFAGYPTDGAYLIAGLLRASDGNFYGTTYQGGNNCSSYGCGTVFRISPAGSETVLYSFRSYPSDGYWPQYAGLVQGSDGNFYGTTYPGGVYGYGTIFRISPGGSYTSLYSFVGFPNDGAYPHAGLVQGNDGNFYGTTQLGGPNGDGTVFRISPGGSYTSLYSFVGFPNDGAQPYAGVVQGSDGNFYGTTYQGGPNGDGTVFRISPGGSYSNLYSFGGSPADGTHSYAALLQGSDGYFYGTTAEGGASTNCPNSGCGTVFRISPGGSYTSLYSFAGSPNDGAQPYDGVVQGSDGNFYGTTFAGGTNNRGAVFKLIILLSPPANQINAVQPAGSDVAVSVSSVAGETYQLQFTTDLTSGNWSNLAGLSVTNSIGALMTLTNLGGALLPQGFYRFDITP